MKNAIKVIVVFGLLFSSSTILAQSKIVSGTALTGGFPMGFMG